MKMFTYDSCEDTSRALIHTIIELMMECPEKIFNIAFSGGSTPAVMYELWANEFRNITPWDRMRVFFVDERCVPPTSVDSNYNLINERLLSQVPIDPLHVFRILGEDDPYNEAIRYSNLIKRELPINHDFPQFDIVLLGIGADGHTSSIFPDQKELLVSKKIYVVTQQPVSGLQRIALTGQPILNANHIFFLVMGADKSKILHSIVVENKQCPASYIIERRADVEIFSDHKASNKIEIIQ